MDTYRNYDWLLGGSFNVEEMDTRRESLVEALSFFIGKFESFRQVQSDKDDISAFDLNEELSLMECAIENITDKLFYDETLNESPETLILALPAAVATIMGGIPIGSALYRTWIREGNVLPKAMRGASHTIGKWLLQATGAERNKRRAELAEKFKKANPKASSIEIQAYISRIEAQEKADNERIKNKILGSKREDIKVKGTHTPAQKPYHLMDDKEKAEYKRRVLPNSGKKKD